MTLSRTHTADTLLRIGPDGKAKVRHLVFAACALLALSALSGCAPRVVPTASDETIQVDAARVFRLFHALHADRPALARARSLEATASLRIVRNGDARRVTLRLWGNAYAGDGTDSGFFTGPVRLDVEAGVGVLVALLREDRTGLTALIPDKRTAYVTDDPARDLDRLGLPLPFSLRELAGLLAGDFRTVPLPASLGGVPGPALFPETYESARLVPDGGFAYTFATGNRVRTLTLDEQGRPIRAAGPDTDPWEMEFSGYDDSPSPETGYPPARIRARAPQEASGAQGTSVLLRIKTAAFREAAWDAGALELELPPGTQVRPVP